MVMGLHVENYKNNHIQFVINKDYNLIAMLPMDEFPYIINLKLQFQTEFSNAWLTFMYTERPR